MSPKIPLLSLHLWCDLRLCSRPSRAHASVSHRPGGGGGMNGVVSSRAPRACRGAGGPPEWHRWAFAVVDIVSIFLRALCVPPVNGARATALNRLRFGTCCISLIPCCPPSGQGRARASVSYEGLGGGGAQRPRKGLRTSNRPPMPGFFSGSLVSGSSLFSRRRMFLMWGGGGSARARQYPKRPPPQPPPPPTPGAQESGLPRAHRAAIRPCAQCMWASPSQSAGKHVVPLTHRHACPPPPPGLRAGNAPRALAPAAAPFPTFRGVGACPPGGAGTALSEAGDPRVAGALRTAVSVGRERRATRLCGRVVVGDGAARRPHCTTPGASLEGGGGRGTLPQHPGPGSAPTAFRCPNTGPNRIPNRQ